MTVLTNGLEKVSDLWPRLSPTIGIGLTRMDPTVDVLEVLG